MDSEDLTYIEVTEEEQEEIDSVLIVNSNYPELSAQLNEYVPIFDNITKMMGCRHVQRIFFNHFHSPL